LVTAPAPDARAGYRGYIVSRPVRGTAYPQRVQNLVVRDFARRNGFAYKLSVTEFAMPDATMMLDQVLGELGSLQGVILFSAFTLPAAPQRRAAIFERILGAGAVLCAALENLIVRDAAGARALEELLAVAALLPEVPFGGRYEKSGAPLVLDPNARALLAADSPAGAAPPIQG
jgi:sporadic carbohydrate cluster protein (TIGR04323 family)